VSVNFATKRTAFLPRTKVLLALASLALLAACQRADDALVPEIRPVRVITIESRASEWRRLADRHGAGADRDQPVVPHRRPAGRAHGGHRRQGKARPTDRAARSAERGERRCRRRVRSSPPRRRSWWRRATIHARMRDLVAEDAVSRASFDQAVAMLKTAEAQVEAVQSQVSLAENRLSYTRCIRCGRRGHRARAGARRGGGGRAHDRAGGTRGRRDAVFDVPRRSRTAPRATPEITVALVSDPGVTAAGRNARGIAARRPGDRHVPVRVRLDRPAGGDATGQHRDRQHAAVGARVSRCPPRRSPAPTGKFCGVGGRPEGFGTVSLRTIEIGPSTRRQVEVASGPEPG
jgi:hypothetical protein